MTNRKGVFPGPGIRRLAALGVLAATVLLALGGQFTGKFGLFRSVFAQEEEERDGLRIKHSKPGSRVYSTFNEAASADGPFYQQAAAFGETPEVKDLPQAFPEKFEIDKFGNPVLFKVMKEPSEINPIVPGAGAGADKYREVPFVDPVLSKNNLNAPQAMPTPMLTFDGVSSDDRNTLFGNRVMPPDTNGDVGGNYYVSIVNGPVGIYNKTTGALAAPQFKLGSLFANLPTSTGCGRDDGDPIVLYDTLADRWMMSQFGIPTGSTSTGPWYECIAVSKTNDPTGAYWVYAFQTPTASGFPDYPKMGIWHNGLYMTDHQNGFLAPPSPGGSGTGFFAFDRAKLLSGDPTAAFIYFNRTTAGEGGIIPADIDGVNPPPASVPMTFFRFTADEFGGTFTDAVVPYEFVPDFTTPANSTFTALNPISVAAFDARQPSGRLDIEQASPATASNNLDSLNDRAMFRIPYQNLGTQANPVNSYMIAWGVNVSGAAAGTVTATSFTSGVRWAELRRNGSTITVRDQGTQASADVDGATGTNRWMPHAAQDNNGNVAVGYSRSSSTTNPDIAWAGRTGSAPTGTLNEGEATMFASTGVQLATNSRWGDYSSMSIDPTDGCTFYYHTEYRKTENNGVSSGFAWNTRVGAFKFPSCTPAQKGTVNVNVTACGVGTPVSGALVSSASGMAQPTGANGVASFVLAPGGYSFNATKKFFSVGSVNATVTNGGTANVSVCLTGVPAIDNGTPTIVSESCGIPNSAPDPGENLTVALPLTNSGGGAATNLTATLQATGGVTNPSGPQSYGALASGATLSKNFSFTVEPATACGSQITLTWKIQDNGADIGTVTKVFGTGTPVINLTQNFDTVTAPALPSGWTQNQLSGTGITWTTVTTSPVSSAPNAAFANDPAAVNDTALESPSFPVSVPNASLSFQKAFTTENGFDGAVLEIKIGSGAWTDIVTAGGAFVSGGYNGSISTAWGSTIGGRQAWTGTSATMTPTVVTLPAAANGQNVQLRWRMASDQSVASTGIRIDDVQVTAGVTCQSCQSQPTAHGPFDFDGDGKTDVSIFRPGASAEWWITNSSNNSVLAAQFGTTGDIAVPADYTGDGKTDMAFFRPSNSTWFVLRSNDFSFYGFQFGASTDVPAPADYDGDHKADAAVFRNGSWFIVRSTDGGVTTATFGVAGDKPVPADYDGDGKADIGIFRPNGGTGGEWWIQRSTAGLLAATFGASTDKTVVGDWTGDGKADCAFFRPSTGTWYVLRSEDFSFFGFPFGNSSDTPAPGDYDGDGKTDAAVFRQPGSQWFINKSSGGVTSLSFGAAGDAPVPGSFVR